MSSVVTEALTEHRESCLDGPERCRDCRTALDAEALTAIDHARDSYSEVEEWIHRTYGDVCIYCGQDSEHLDHLVPRPWTGPAARRYVPTVPACADCNCRLNDVPLFTIRDRSLHLANALRAKWRKQLTILDRTDEELAAFGDRLRRDLIAKQHHRQVIRRRLEMLDMGGACWVAIQGRAAA